MQGMAHLLSLGWVALLASSIAVALVPATPAAAALPGDLRLQGAEPCHKGHCHGPKVCGGGWKDYREPLQAEAAGPSADAACANAEAQLVERATAEAAERCLALHPCGDCPEGCGGCKSERPAGRIDSDGSRRHTATLPDGSARCEVDSEAIYRCRCGGCKKLTP